MVQHDDVGDDDAIHQRKVVECIRSRQLRRPTSGEGHLSAIHRHRANIVARAGHKPYALGHAEAFVVADPFTAAAQSVTG